MQSKYTIREIPPDEFDRLGQSLLGAYSQLEGFPGREEHPDYYHLLTNIRDFTEDRDSQVLVAVSSTKNLLGGVVCIGDMADYGAGGSATRVKNATGIRFLWVAPEARFMGVGKALTNACIHKARDKGQSQIVLHTTAAMTIAWQLYEGMGFERSKDLDFTHDGLPDFGFRLQI